MTPPKRGTPAHRAIATAVWILAAVGLMSIILWPGPIVVWALMIFFGAAAFQRALLESLRVRQNGSQR